MKTETIVLLVFGVAILALGGLIAWLLSQSQDAPPAPAVSEVEGVGEKIGAGVDALLGAFESLTTSIRRA